MFKAKKRLSNGELSKDLSLLLLIGGLYSLSVALSNTFVNIYLWRQSGKYIDLGLYNLAIVFIQPFTVLLAGKWAKKIDRVMVLRMGVIFLAAFYLIVLIIGTNASDFLLLLGGMLGIGYGCYWLAFNILTFELTEPETRDFFNGLLGILTSAGGMIGPIAAGFIISRMEKFTGYSVVFGLSLLMFSLAVILSFFIKPRPAKGEFFFQQILKERKENKDWRLITNAHFFQGIREGTFAFVISVFVFLSTGSELSLGTFGLINSGIAFIAFYGVSKIVKRHQRKKAILLGAALLWLSILIILFDVTYAKLLIYGALIALGYPLLLVPFMSLSYDVIGKGWRAADLRIEYIVVREIFMNSGRIVSILIFLIAISLYDAKKMMPFLLVGLGAGYLAIYFLVSRVKTSPT